MAGHEARPVATGYPNSAYRHAIIAGGIPEGAKLETGKYGNVTGRLPDGSDISMNVEGDHITRSMRLDGVNGVSVPTGIQCTDFSMALGNYETVKQDLAPKIDHMQGALSFLENPAYANTPLADFQHGLRKILGYTLYTNLGVEHMDSKASLFSALGMKV